MASKKQETLLALKSFRHGRLKVKSGDMLSVSNGMAVVYVAAGFAKRIDGKQVKRVAKVKSYKETGERPVLTRPAQDVMTMLRKKYEYLSGNAPDGRWSVRRLEAEIAELESGDDSEDEDDGRDENDEDENNEVEG
jgi:hypothetical protein